MLFTLSVACNLETAQIDFRNAFVQSTLPEPIYLELPPGGFHKNKELAGKVLKVNKSLYGDRHAPKLWYNHLRKGLKGLGFQASKYELCLFMREGCIIVTYVDDAIVLAKNRSQVDYVLDGLRKLQFDFDEMGN